jgi:hypothetical protein
MPFSLVDVARDPDLAQQFTILRSKGFFGAGGWQDAVIQVPSYGVIGIADDEALVQIPEGDRVTGSLQLVCEFQIYETQEKRDGLSDKIGWNSNTYRVQSVAPWKDFGFWSAILVRIQGA